MNYLVKLKRVAVVTAMALAVGIPSAAIAQEQTRLRIVFVSQSGPGNPFYGPILKGFEQAGMDLNIETIFRGQQGNLLGSAAETLTAIENAIATNPDGLVISNAYPEVLNATIKSATDAGIPVVLTNAGFGEAETTGALAFVGCNETELGQLAGELLLKVGATNALVVTAPPGIPLIDDRVRGFTEAFAPSSTSVVEVPIEALGDATRLVNTTLAALEKDPTIDAVFSIGSCCGPAMVTVREELGARADSMHFVTIDLGAPVLQALADKKIDFAIDQQQYLEGYIPVLMIAQYLRYGLKPVETFYPTGPAVISAENAQKVMDLAAQNIR